MMTPFELVEAQKVVKKIVCTHKKGVIRNINTLGNCLGKFFLTRVK